MMTIAIFNLFAAFVCAISVWFKVNGENYGLAFFMGFLTLLNLGLFFITSNS